MTEVEEINYELFAIYRTIEGRALYKIVWSEDCFENRLGTYREFTESGLFIREVTEVRKVRKYNYIHHRWIFEIWAPGNLTANPETPDAANGDYIPVYVFESGTGAYLPVTRKVVEFLIAAVEGRVRRDLLPSEDYIAEKEIQQVVEMLDDHPSDWQTRPGPARNAIWFKGFNPSKIESDS